MKFLIKKLERNLKIGFLFNFNVYSKFEKWFVVTIYFLTGKKKKKKKNKNKTACAKKKELIKLYAINQQIWIIFTLRSSHPIKNSSR